MAGNSISHCEEKIRWFKAEYDANQTRATKALEELTWWQKELIAAQKNDFLKKQAEIKAAANDGNRNRY